MALTLVPFMGVSEGKVPKQAFLFEEVLANRIKLHYRTIVLPSDSLRQVLKEYPASILRKFDVANSVKVCRLLKTDSILLIEFDHVSNAFSATLHFYRSDGKSAAITASQSNIYELVESLLKDAPPWICGEPRTDVESQKEEWTQSISAMEWYSEARHLLANSAALSKVEEACRRALEADTNFIQAGSLLAATFASEGKWEDARNYAKWTLQRKPCDAGASRVLGVGCLTTGRISDAESYLRTAIHCDPADSYSCVQLGYLYSQTEDFTKAIEMFERCLLLNPYSPNANAVHAQLGFIYALCNLRESAEYHLAFAAHSSRQKDAWVEQNLWNGFAALRDIPRSIEHCEKLLQLSKDNGASGAILTSLDAYIKQWEPRLTPFVVPGNAPKDFSPAEISEAIRLKLTAAEGGGITNPLEPDSGLVNYAKALCFGLSTDVEKSKALFEWIIQHVDNSAVMREELSTSANEAFRICTSNSGSLHCRDGTFLFLAMARAVGVRAHAASIEEACDGNQTLHMCAEIFTSNGNFLIDPSYFWFGAPHRRFKLLDDLECIALNLAASPELEKCRVASKLAPTLALVQYNLCWRLIALEQWSEANRVFSDLRRLDTVGAMTLCLSAEFALHEHRPSDAVQLALRALKTDPNRAFYHIELGRAYCAQGMWDLAKEAFQNALHYPHTDQQAIDIAAMVENVQAQRQ